MTSSALTALAVVALALFAQGPSLVIPDPPHACDARSYAGDARGRLEARILEEPGAKPGEDK